MSGRNRILTPNGDLAPGIGGPQPLLVAAPFNDVQLVAMMAAQRQDETPEEAVLWAAEAVAHAVVHGNPQKVGEIVERLRRRAAAQESPQPA